MAFAIACILWLAAFAAAGLSAVSQGPSAGAMAGMALQDPLNQRLVDTVGLLPGNQWRHEVEQGRRLAKERDGHLYQMLLAWFQHDILGLYGDGIHLTVAHKREWSYGFKPDNKTVPLPCYLESPYDHQRESSTSQTQPARARQRAQ
ncbi:hypothetical protein [Aeromonas sp. 97A]